MLRNSLTPRSLWLIAEHHNARMEVLTVDLANGEALPVFSFKEEAELFLRLEVSRMGWRVREATGGELISILCGPCAGIQQVVLDPPPKILGKMTAGLLSLSRKDFVRTLMYKGGPAEPHDPRFERRHPSTPYLLKLGGERECCRRRFC